MMELRHFRCFLAVARLLHFSRAAAELGISPPALSKQIQEAERHLGTPLFYRSKRTVTLTAAGALFQLEAGQALAMLAQAQEVARRAGRGELGRVEIGYVASAAFAGVLQAQLARLRASHPGVLAHAVEYPMESLADLLQQGRIDIAFVRPPLPLPDDVDSVLLLHDYFVLAAPAGGPFGTLDQVDAGQLADETFIVPEQEVGTLEVGRRGGFEPRIGARPGSLLAVLIAVSLGAGCAVVPHSVVACLRIPGVHYLDLRGAPLPSELAAAYRRFEKAPAVRALIAQLQAGAAPRPPPL